MKTYDFTFVVDADPLADDFEDRFIAAGCDDATFVLRRGAAALCFDRAAVTYKDAVLSAYQNIKAAGSEVLRFEPDFLVTASDIAERSGLTRAAINLFDKGERRQGFPLPVARFNAKSPLYDWVQVSKWLWDQGKIDEQAFYDAQVSRIVNQYAQSRQGLGKAGKSIEKLLTGPLEPV